MYKRDVVLHRVTISGHSFASFFPNTVCRCNHYTVVIVQRSGEVSEVVSVDSFFFEISKK